ncbi:MAG: hypothetical protein AAGA60_09420 [Cyanobacteria bacterium P01_E01_bin.42]
MEKSQAEPHDRQVRWANLILEMMGGPDGNREALGRDIGVSGTTVQDYVGSKSNIGVAKTDPEDIRFRNIKAVARLAEWSLDELDNYLQTGIKPRELGEIEQFNPIPAIEFTDLESLFPEKIELEDIGQWLRQGRSGEDWQQSGILVGNYRSNVESPEQILFSELETYRVKAIAIGDGKIALGVGASGIRVGENLQAVRVVPKILPLEPESFPDGLKFSVSQEGIVYQSFDIPPKRGAIKVGGEGFVLDAGDRFELKFALGEDIVEEKFIV